MSNDEIHDTSRLDALMRNRQRIAFMHSVWKPVIAGAAGATAIIGAVVVGVWVAGPRLSYREIEIPRVVLKDVPINNLIPHETIIEIPRIVETPKVASPPLAAPYAPHTPDEQKFVDKPEFQGAIYRGRIVHSTDDKGLWFADGKNFYPAHWDPDTHQPVGNSDKAFESDPYVGDLGMCVEEKDHMNLWDCIAMHGGQEVLIPYKPKNAVAAPRPRHDDQADVINVDVDVAGYPVTAEVDTGCSWPMAIGSALADELLKRRLAIRAGSSKSVLADGSVRDVDVLMISQITVHGRALQDVEASVTPSSDALTLLGLGALNRLGPFKIEDGKIVFTGEPT